MTKYFICILFFKTLKLVSEQTFTTNLLICLKLEVIW